MSFEKKLSKAIKHNNPYKIEQIFEEIYYEYGKLVGFIISKYVNNQYLGLPKLVIWDFFICDNYNKPLYLGKG